MGANMIRSFSSSRPDLFPLLVENSPYGRFVTGGYLVYFRGGKLFAVSFNLDKLEISGPAVLLVDGVAADTMRGAVFEVSLSGTLLYRSGSEDSQLFELNSSGKIEPLSVQPGAYLTPRMSPDGRRLALAVTQGGAQHLWIYSLDNGFMKRLTFNDSEVQLLPVWTPDGEFVAFRSGSTLAWARSDGGGMVEHLESPNLNPLPSSFSPDGKYLVFAGDDPKTGLDLYVAPVKRAADAMHLGPP
jgi:Tol biopolymer transport system component